jgi:SNF2 family DNA or RNA helicase
MKAEDYIQMPMRTDNFIPLRLPDELKKKYREFEREKVLELFDTANDETTEINVVNAAALSNKLLQFANGAMYDENSEVHEIHSIKIDALKEIIEDANGKSVLVAWTYRFDRDRLMEALAKYKPRELKTPEDISDWNKGKVQVMLAHPASAGHGLNLQAGGSIVVWFGLTWSLELYQQFNARLYRQGQNKHVIINHLVMTDTHDEDVIQAIKRKATKQNGLMESIKAKIQKYKKQYGK